MQRLFGVLVAFGVAGSALADTRLTVEYTLGEKTQTVTAVLSGKKCQAVLPDGRIVLVDRDKGRVSVLSPTEKRYWSAKLKDAVSMPSMDTSGMPMRLGLKAAVQLGSAQGTSRLAEQDIEVRPLTGELTVQPEGMPGGGGGFPGGGFPRGGGGFPGGGFPGGGGQRPQMPKINLTGEIQLGALADNEEAQLATDLLCISLQEQLSMPNPFLRALHAELLKTKRAPFALTLKGGGMPSEAEAPTVRFQLVKVEKQTSSDPALFTVPSDYRSQARPEAKISLPTPSRQ